MKRRAALLLLGAAAARSAIDGEGNEPITEADCSASKSLPAGSIVIVEVPLMFNRRESFAQLRENIEKRVPDGVEVVIVAEGIKMSILNGDGVNELKGTP